MARKWLLRICIIAAASLAGCGPSAVPVPAPSRDLLILLRPGPASWDTREEDQRGGIDYELAQIFARQLESKLRIIPAVDPASELARPDRTAVIGAGGVYLPDAPTLADASLIYSASYFSVAPVVIFNGTGFKPESWKDLAGQDVGVLKGSGLAGLLSDVRSAHKDVRWQLVDVASTEALISRVSDGTLDYAVVASNEAEAAYNVYLGFDIGFAATKKQPLVWAFPRGETVLRDQVNGMLDKMRADGSLQRMLDHYFTFSRVPRVDAGAFQQRIRSVLPGYRDLFEHVQKTTGVDWRLLAAISYQESQWDTQAASETGALGLMQLTEETARHLGAVNRLDAHSNVMAAARYLLNLKDKLPKRIREPDRTWLALASYNIGVAHLEDARVLAQKQKLNPDSWNAVKTALPLLALPEYYAEAKFGYARGGMPVAFVDRVRAYYDILLTQQPAMKPRLQAFWRLGEPPVRSDEPVLGRR